MLDIQTFLSNTPNRMFRALDLLRKEEGYVDHNSFVKQQTQTFTKRLPNSYLTTQTDPKLMDTTSLGFGYWDPNTRQLSTKDSDLSVLATSIGVSERLVQENQQCTTATLDDLVNTQDPNAKVRCGWLYQKGTPGSQPKISQGVLGTRNGPMTFFQNPGGTYYWDLDKAKQQILKDRCAALTTCENVGSPEYASCAFSTSRGIGVPVTSKGALMYPRDPTLSAPSNSLITSSSSCPKPPPPGSPQYNLMRSRDVCIPLEDGRLPRDCILQQITASGCKTDGQLYQSLINSATPTNYGAGLMNTMSYKKYQQLSENPLLEDAVRIGKTTKELALGNFKQLVKVSSEVNDLAVNFAARDLCLRKGIMDEYDFCVDLVDGSPAPFAIECLQKEFRVQGGQPAGIAYPSAKTKGEWDRLGTWKAVKDAILGLATECKSKDDKKQREALVKFMGIERETPIKQCRYINGIEVYWFNRANGTFLGRRTAITNPSFPSFSTGGEVEKTGLADFVEYYVVVNVRPPTTMDVRLRLETDDGMMWVLNKNIDSVGTRGFNMDTSTDFIRNWDQAPTQHTSSQCWKLVGKGPNYIMGFWQETGGWAHSQLFYTDCTQSTYQRIPPAWLSLTQEPDAPMFSWEGMATFQRTYAFREYRFPTLMAITISPKAKTVETGIRSMPLGLQLRPTNENGFAIVQKNISTNSWRSMTVAFFSQESIGQNFGSCKTYGYPSSDNNIRLYTRGDCDAIGGNFHGNGECTKPQGGSFSWDCRGLNTYIAPILCKLGNLTISLQGSSIIFTYQSATLKMSKAFNNVIKTDNQTPHLAVVNLRSDYDGQYPNRITVAIGTFEDWKAGRVTMTNFSGQTYSQSTEGNNPIFNPSDFSQLSIGDQNGQQSANATVTWARLFDYELDTNDVVRDVNNAWERSFINAA